MRAYVDTSVVLRLIMREPDPLPEWPHITFGTTSTITRVECLRSLDRVRLAGLVPSNAHRVSAREQDRLAKRDIARRTATAEQFVGHLDKVELRQAVLDRASEPFPEPLRALDAIHLASAICARRGIPALRFATHDDDLAAAARAMGFRVIGA